MAKARGTTKSRGKVTTKENPGGQRNSGSAPRPHRNDTPEAKTQRKRMPKTHPGRTAGVRKDKGL